MEPLRHVSKPGFGAVIFRRTSPEITNEGALWDESVKLYSQMGAFPRISEHSWNFPAGPSVTFGHMQYETDVLKWHSSQICLIGFDELTTFTEYQFWYMFSRNRSTCGVRPYIRATTNPDADSWVAKLIAWWIDQETGYAIPERSGVIRWFVRRDNVLHWADSAQELRELFPGSEPKSFTFIAASLEDNLTLMECDPGYRANLLALHDVERERLLGGNWKIRNAAGMFFKVAAITVVADAPSPIARTVRAWDLAATHGAGDYTSGVKVASLEDGRWCFLHVTTGQWSAEERDKRILQCAESDGRRCKVRLPQDPGQAGKSQMAYLSPKLAGFNFEFLPVSGDKQVRAQALAAQVNAGNVLMIAGEWNESFLYRLDRFQTKGVPDDDVDAAADAFNDLTSKKKLVVGV